MIWLTSIIISKLMLHKQKICKNSGSSALFSCLTLHSLLVFYVHYVLCEGANSLSGLIFPMDEIRSLKCNTAFGSVIYWGFHRGLFTYLVVSYLFVHTMLYGHFVDRCFQLLHKGRVLFTGVSFVDSLPISLSLTFLCTLCFMGIWWIDVSNSCKLAI